MSKEKAKQFYDGIKDNEGLKNQLKEQRPSSTEEVVAFAKKFGFDFTTDEWKEIGKEIAKISERLSDDELDKVVGGEMTPVTIGYGCDKWVGTNRPWLCVKGTCGSCVEWEINADLVPLHLIGLPGLCRML